MKLRTIILRLRVQPLASVNWLDSNLECYVQMYVGFDESKPQLRFPLRILLHISVGKVNLNFLVLELCFLAPRQLIPLYVVYQNSVVGLK